MSEETKLKKYRNSPVIGEGGDNFLSDDDKAQTIHKALKETLHWYKHTPVKSDEEAEERIVEYFQYCVDNNVRPTIEELALALGVARNTLYDWESGKTHTVSSNIIKRAKEYVACFDAKMVAEGKLNPVTYIFRSKNYYGMRDQTEHILTPNQNTVDKDELLREAEMLPE